MNTCPYCYFEYRIGTHDTYAALAKKYRMPEKRLRDYNNNARLLPGSSIKIPYTTGGCKNGAFYAIRRGETLSDIAKRNGLNLNDILLANPYLNPNCYVVGQVIIIPQQGNSDGTLVYTVKPNEMLFDVLRKFDMDVNTFSLLNDGIDPVNLMSGQRIIVLERSCDNTCKWYEIKEGDTPTSIAEKFSVKLSKLLGINQNLRPSEFTPGVRIRIPSQ